MAKFITLTEAGPQGRTIAVNIDTIEYMLPRPNNGGTEIVTVTHHTKYIVRESLDDILDRVTPTQKAISEEERVARNMARRMLKDIHEGRLPELDLHE